MSATRIVIVGGGIAGIELATGLGRRRAFDVTLVDKSLSHVWKPMLHGFAAGTARPDRQRLSFLAHAKRHAYRFEAGTLAGVDRAARTIRLHPFEADGAPDRTLSYDLLVLALGSRANDFGTKGVLEHCRFLDDLAGAEAFHAALRHELFAAAETGRQVRIAIVGGGATGVELAAELKHAVDVTATYGAPGLASGLRLTLLESGDRLLPAMPPAIGAGASDTLRRLGVEVRTGAMVTEADAAGFVLKDGSRIEADLLVWAAGVKGPDATASIEGIAHDHAGRISVGPGFAVQGDDAVLAIGDCASQTPPDGGKPVPPTAQAARQQALHLRRNIDDWTRERRIRPFHYHDKGSIVSLADFNGWGTLGKTVFGGGHLRGLSARLAHDMLYRQHQIEVEGLAHGLAAWLVDAVERRISPKVRLD